MAIVKKVINNSEYLYAQKSFRLPDGKIKTVSKKIHSANEYQARQTQMVLREQQQTVYENYALKNYKTSHILTEKRFKEFESYRVGFKYLRARLEKAQFNELLKRFTVNFTFESNALEGNTLSLRDVTLFIFDKITPAGKNLREIYETRNLYHVHELLLANKFKLTKEHVLKIQALVVKDMDITTGWKKVPNYLLGRSVQTTKPEDVESAVQNLIKWYDESKTHTHPLQLAAEFHAKFEKIHPFEDGNGRVGRILSNVILLSNGFPPIIIRKTQRVRYFACLQAADLGHFPKIHQFFVEKFRKTYKDFFLETEKYV